MIKLLHIFPDSSQTDATMIVQQVKNPLAMQEIPVRFLGQEDLLEEETGYPLQYSRASLAAQLAKNPPAMWETWV